MAQKAQVYLTVECTIHHHSVCVFPKAISFICSAYGSGSRVFISFFVFCIFPVFHSLCQSDGCRSALWPAVGKEKKRQQQHNEHLAHFENVQQTCCLLEGTCLEVDVGGSEQKMLVGGRPATEPPVTATSCSKALFGEPFAKGTVAGELLGLQYTLILCQNTFPMQGKGSWITDYTGSL